MYIYLLLLLLFYIYEELITSLQILCNLNSLAVPAPPSTHRRFVYDGCLARSMFVGSSTAPLIHMLGSR